LGEIEAVLEEHADIQQAVAVAREDPARGKYLAVYYMLSGRQQPSLEDLRRHLRNKLPEYMIPAAFVRLEAIPVTPNGKVDRKALPPPTAADYRLEREFAAPRDRIEKKLAAIWDRVLQIRPIGIHDNFFELGGRSMMAARMFMQISSSFGKELPITTLLRAPTIELLAKEVREASGAAGYPTLVPMRAGGSKPPFFCVHGGAGSTLFLKSLAARMDPDRPFYGIEPEGLDGGPFHRTTLERIAAHYLAEIRKVQSAGPYSIGGYCYGGIVAFEMAQQLLAQGEAQPVLVLLTAPLRFNRMDSGKAKAPALSWSQRLAGFRAAPWECVRLRSAALYSRWLRPMPGRGRDAFYRLWLALGLRIPQSMRRTYIHETLLRTEKSYRPKFYPGTLVLFHGSGLTEAGLDLGWDGLANRIEHRVIGDSNYRTRRQLMDDPLVGLTARELEACLDPPPAAS
jgi:thioesterase domain-containing protein